MVKYYCDKCGKELDPHKRIIYTEEWHYESKDRRRWSGLNAYDVCPKCSKTMDRLKREVKISDEMKFKMERK